VVTATAPITYNSGTQAVGIDLTNIAQRNTANAFTGAQTVTAGAVGQVPLTLAGTSGQTADLFSVTGTVGTTSINSQGLLINTGPVQTNGLRNPSVQTVLSLGTAGITVFANNPTAANKGFVVRSPASVTGSVFETQDVSGSTRFYVDAAHNTNFSSASWVQNSTGRLTVGLTSATAVGVTVRGAASQTADLQQWQNSAGALVANMTASGTLALYGNGITSGDHRIGTASYYSATLSVQARSATEKGQVVRGFASQTANLQEWQYSDGVVAAMVTAGGFLRAERFASWNQFVFGSERNSGGEMTFTRQTAVSTNPGANLARLYFRDGTNAGTLRLVVRAGAAGAETTILDNIPQ
jgi:hypothetical protein